MPKSTDSANRDPLDVGREPFFRRVDWSAFWVATLVTFGVYFYTLAPTVTLEDSGELATAGDYMGVPHPPGYPIWAMISWIFARVFQFVPFRGQPNPAWGIALASAVFGALAAGISAMLICRSGADLLRQSRETLHRTDERVQNTFCWAAGVASSLLFAFSPCMWSQSVIVEVYSLNAFFLVLIFLLTYWWMCAPSDRLLAVTALVFGLGLTNYQVLLLAIVPLVVAILLRDMQLFRGFVIVGAPFLIVMKGIGAGLLPAISHPLNQDCFIYLSLNALVLTLSYFFLPRGRTVALTIFMAELGVAFYAYMPIVSDLRNPPMNWGFPRTWEGFQHAITRGQYERISPTNIFSLLFLKQIGSYFTDLREQFTLPVALLGFLPFTIWQMRVRGRRVDGLSIGVVLCVLAVAALMLEHLLLATIGTDPLRSDKWFVAGVLLSLCVGGLALMTHRGLEFWDRLTGRTPTSTLDRFTIGAAAVGVLGAYALYVKALAGKISEVAGPLRQATVTPAQTHAIMAGIATLVILMAVPPALGLLSVWLTRGQQKLRMVVDENSEKWVLATLSGFLVMSLVLVALASPKGDIQDSFIQRVKFISSHALFAFWIGYGLLLGLAWFETVTKGRAVLRWLALALVLASPLIPILRNGYSKELIRVVGGAEQHGHDFGWQFGNYQLRGAAAISEELALDEEPLPNPAFPPPMGTNAIFYGGTDPGRFVPTYMIYSAHVREDVYLITQNALADNTYMNVMRDLYGDQIWIPAQQDSANAFRIYVEEVQAGKRQANADLQIENGRVQVSGALGVMEINGILAQMIFDHNKHAHEFYVEESYVIQWMYPYLTPHGLIMEINPQQTQLTPEHARDDLDFWDWYVRRLHGNEKFLRDVVARKSFSKLRSAIGGLYASRGMMRNAERAFHEARVLYPLSPEANFRLVQEVLLREGRFGEAKDIMQEYAEADPGNDRVPEFLNQLGRIQGLDERIRTLEGKRREGKMDVNSALDLAQAYQEGAQHNRFLDVIDSVMTTSNLPPQYLYQAATLLYSAKDYKRMDSALERCVAQLPSNSPPELYLNMVRMYMDAQMPVRMVTSLQRYLQVNPSDWKAWLDMTYILMSVQETNGAVRALETARRVGGAEAEDTIQRDDRFAPLLRGIAPPAAASLLGVPGVGD